jgi:hypothetical protein
VQALRQHAIVRVFVCLLLTWAAADLFVPQLCSAEASAQSEQTPVGSGDHDDCFCCCSHTESTPFVVVMVSSGVPAVAVRMPAAALPAGVPRNLYHPPLSL